MVYNVNPIVRLHKVSYTKLSICLHYLPQLVNLSDVFGFKCWTLWSAIFFCSWFKQHWWCKVTITCRCGQQFSWTSQARWLGKTPLNLSLKTKHPREIYTNSIPILQRSRASCNLTWNLWGHHSNKLQYLRVCKMSCLAYVPPFKQPSIMLAPFLTSHAATSQFLHSSISILLFAGSTIYLSPGTYTEGVHQNVPSIPKSLHNYKIKNQFKDFTKQSGHSHYPGPSTLQSLTNFRSLSENIMLLG